MSISASRSGGITDAIAAPAQIVPGKALAAEGDLAALSGLDFADTPAEAPALAVRQPEATGKKRAPKVVRKAVR